MPRDVDPTVRVAAAQKRRRQIPEDHHSRVRQSLTEALDRGVGCDRQFLALEFAIYRKRSLEDFDFDHQRSVKREVIAHLGPVDFVAGKENVIFLGPPGTGKTHLATGLGIRACQAGHRVAFGTAAQWVTRLAEAHQAGRLSDELTRLGRIPLIVVDEVGYIPFEPEAANLFFQFMSGRYERASVILTSNKPFGRWGDVFGDDTVAAAMIDRLVHHAEVISLKRDSYACAAATSDGFPPPTPGNDQHQLTQQGGYFSPAGIGSHFKVQALIP